MTIKKIKAELKKMGYIGILWHEDDIIETARKNNHTLSQKDASIILQNLQHNHDCNYGITWETINAEIGSFIDKKLGV